MDKASVLYALHFYSWNLSECMAMGKALVGIDLFALCNAPRFHRRVPAVLNHQDPPTHSWDSESCGETDRESQDVKSQSYQELYYLTPHMQITNSCGRRLDWSSLFKWGT